MPGFIHTHFATGASAAALTATPAADAEIQAYNNSMKARLLTLHANASALATAATAQTLFNVQITQEPSYIFSGAAITAGIPVTDQNDGLVATGIPREANWTPVDKICARDQDLVFMMNGPGSDEGMIAANIAYLEGGQPPRWPEGKLFWVQLDDAADSAQDTWDEISTSPINNLDPQKMYALVAAAAITEDAAGGAARFEAPSFNGLKPGVVVANGYNLTWFRDGKGNPAVAGIFSGSESLTCQVYNFAAQKMGVIVGLIEIGSTAAVATPGGGGRVAVGPGPVLGNFGGIVRRGLLG